ncbi:MAG: 3-phosphoshikimate 1-carboxyvinyltransferase, partial [Mycobacterium sp.]|nr:3-phosphoshikimate 1-carboxyvinyltransferase [Mycobacterium sp.]
MNHWPAPHAPAPVDASVTVPGSKSMTNRALILAALSGAAQVSGALRSRDTDLMIGALQTLGVRIDGDGTELTVGGTLDPGAGARIDCGLAGTVLRFVPPLAALSTGAVRFDGDEQARARPITPLLDALRGLGVEIDGDGLPFTVHGRGAVPGGTVHIDASASSQFVSGLLLSGAAFTDGLTVVHSGASVPSAPHIAMTVAMLAEAGIEVDETVPNRWRVEPGRIDSRHWRIEPDLSNAVPFAAAAAVTGGTVRIAGWPTISVQPAPIILSILRLLNCTVVHESSGLAVSGPASYSGFDMDLHEVGELTPSMAALAALAEPGSVSRLTGIAHLRGHETDRLAALSAEINGLGGDCAEEADALVITARPLHGGLWRSYADHRMAMGGAIIGPRGPGVQGGGIAPPTKTPPGFPGM